MVPALNEPKCRGKKNTNNDNSRQTDKVLGKHPKRTEKGKINFILEDLARCHKQLGFENTQTMNLSLNTEVRACNGESTGVGTVCLVQWGKVGKCQTSCEILKVI